MAGTKTEWTKAHLQKLLAALKTSIPEHGRMTTYQNGLKIVDWKEVAFPPFSPQACQEKLAQILRKMRKIRSLTELIVEAEDVISNAGQNIKIHPEHPKRPSPPNAMFYEENCVEYQKKHPDMSQEKLFKRLTKKYEELPDEEKAPYVQKFELATEEYSRRMQEFCKKYKKPPNPETNRKRKRLSADTPDQREQSSGDEKDMPHKPPVSGFHIFCQELRMPTNVSSQYWQDLTDTKKDEYNTLCKELKRQYLVKLKTHLNNFNTEKQQQILNKKNMRRFRALKGKGRTEEDALSGEPKKPSRSGNQYFIKNQMVLLKEKFPGSRERLGKASHMWHSLSNKEKERYKEEARAGLRKYRIELQKWLKTLPAAEREAYQRRNPSQKKEYRGNNDTESPDGEDSCDAVYRPSDSEDEDIEYSSSDEEENDSDRCEVEEEEEEDNDAFMFELY
ncbi:nucleolar transcription factor 1-like isoform X1 [Sebastes umbrosus]|uniref:nucleolar transcription factor 1-like isoform X1 n=1 Tax=Sebastes umbrosus TaxID=72105 RepID=UPI00189F1E69|nr:nucleolar transcription factor 1-like isoform X1 [Sebastes umbrosus]